MGRIWDAKWTGNLPNLGPFRSPWWETVNEPVGQISHINSTFHHFMQKSGMNSNWKIFHWILRTLWMSHLYVLGDDLSFCSWDVRLCVGSWFEPEGDQPADEDDSSLKEALLGAVQCFATILLPAHHTVVRLRTHRRHICTDRWKYNVVTLKLHWWHDGVWWLQPPVRNQPSIGL